MQTSSTDLKIYDRLSQIYDLGWSRWPEEYSNFISQLFMESNKNQAKILDLACGTGMLAISLASKGYFVHGIDISVEMIAKAKSKSAGLNNVSFHIEDMTRFRVLEQFDLITCTSDSINYLDKIDSIKELFRRAASVLCKSGLFLFDSNTEQCYININKGSKQVELGQETFLVECKYCPITKQATTIFKFADGSTETHEQRPYGLSELEPILAGAGFKVIKTMSWFDGRAYNAESAKLICLAQRIY